MPDYDSDAAAFFDLDRTLIESNSGFLYALYEFRRGKISIFRFCQATVWMGLYHLSLIDIEQALGKAVGHYRGESEEELMALTREFFEEHVVDSIQPGARRALRRHRRQDHPLVLLTASSSYISRLAADQWRLDDWICNRFPTDDQGRLRGVLEEPICYGEGKVKRASRWANRYNIDLERCYFYTDSYSDLPMLERVGHPRVVNPDPRLRRAAHKRQWPIADWSTPASQ